jgi:hypothetical protein
LVWIAALALFSGCNTMKNADRNVEINHGRVEDTSTAEQPSNGPARKIPVPGTTGTSVSPAVPGPTQNNAGAAATTTEDRWNSAPPNNSVPSASPPNQQ